MFRNREAAGTGTRWRPEIYAESEWDAGRMEGPTEASVYIGEPLYKMEFHVFVVISMCFAAQKGFSDRGILPARLILPFQKRTLSDEQDADAVRNNSNFSTKNNKSEGKRYENCSFKRIQSGAKELYYCK